MSRAKILRERRRPRKRNKIRDDTVDLSLSPSFPYLSLSIVHLFRFAGNEDICFRVLDPAGRCLDAGVAKNTRRNIPLRTFHHLFFILLAHFISLPLPPLPIFLSLFLRTDPRWSAFENNV